MMIETKRSEMIIIENGEIQREESVYHQASITEVDAMMKRVYDGECEEKVRKEFLSKIGG